WWDFRYRIAEGCDVRALWPRPPAQQDKLGAPPEHDWDDYEQKFQQLWREKGDFLFPQNQVEGWNIAKRLRPRRYWTTSRHASKTARCPTKKPSRAIYPVGRTSFARLWSIINTLHYAPLRSPKSEQLV